VVVFFFCRSGSGSVVLAHTYNSATFADSGRSLVKRGLAFVLLALLVRIL
jgi:hypothetical protein